MMMTMNTVSRTRMQQIATATIALLLINERGQKLGIDKSRGRRHARTRHAPLCCIRFVHTFRTQTLSPSAFEFLLEFIVTC